MRRYDLPAALASGKLATCTANGTDTGGARGGQGCC